MFASAENLFTSRTTQLFSNEKKNVVTCGLGIYVGNLFVSIPLQNDTVA